MTVRKESLLVTADADTAGYVAGMDKMAAASKRAAEASDVLEKSTQRIVSQSSGAGAYTRIMKDVDPAFAAQVKYERSISTLSDIFSRGKISAEEHARAVAGVQQKYGSLAPVLDKSRRGMEIYGDATKLTRFQMLTMQYTINDVIASLASGISPLTILMQQGGQVTQAFGGLGATLAALLTPTRLAVVGLAAFTFGFYELTKAVNDNERLLRSFEVSLLATGRASQLTRVEMEGYINQMSRLSGVSNTEAKQSLKALLDARQVGVDTYGKLIPLAGDYAAVTGKTLPKAMEELAKGMQKPSAWANDLHTKFGVLTYAQYENILALEKQGKAFAANDIIVEALSKRLTGARKDAMTPLDEAIKKLTDSWDKFTQSAMDDSWTVPFLEALARAVDALRTLPTYLGLITKSFSITTDVVRSLALGPDAKWKGTVGTTPTGGATAVAESPALPGSKSAVSGQDTRTFEEMKKQADEVAREQHKAFEKILKDLKEQKQLQDQIREGYDSQIQGLKGETAALYMNDRELFIAKELHKADAYLKHASVEETYRMKAALTEEAGAHYDAAQAAKVRRQAEADLKEFVTSSSKEISKSLAQMFVEGADSAVSFRDIAIRAIEDVIDRLIYMNMIKPFTDSASSSLSGSGIGSFFLSMFGGGMASGGSVSPGHSYTVGENGRETFIPSTQGQIVPANNNSVSPQFNFNVTVSGPAASDSKAAAGAGNAFALAAKAKIIEIIEEQKRPGGSLQGVA